MEVSGLKCDNPECEWEDISIPLDDYEKWIDAPCPDCGENVLTQQDYDQTMQTKHFYINQL